MRKIISDLLNSNNTPSEVVDSIVAMEDIPKKEVMMFDIIGLHQPFKVYGPIKADKEDIVPLKNFKTNNIWETITKDQYNKLLDESQINITIPYSRSMLLIRKRGKFNV